MRIVVHPLCSLSLTPALFKSRCSFPLASSLRVLSASLFKPVSPAPMSLLWHFGPYGHSKLTQKNEFEAMIHIRERTRGVCLSSLTYLI